mmetsp:Transcript_87098/g.233260  ORF Transcript_87098/g.233260 Transcript_87098/m.233260 type:complete len:213 (-) Transcript_87098:268-906(-)
MRMCDYLVQAQAPRHRRRRNLAMQSDAVQHPLGVHPPLLRPGHENAAVRQGLHALEVGHEDACKDIHEEKPVDYQHCDEDPGHGGVGVAHGGLVGPDCVHARKHIRVPIALSRDHKERQHRAAQVIIIPVPPNPLAAAQGTRLRIFDTRDAAQAVGAHEQLHADDPKHDHAKHDKKNQPCHLRNRTQDGPQNDPHPLRPHNHPKRPQGTQTP